MTRTKLTWRHAAPLAALFGAWMATSGTAHALSLAPDNEDLVAVTGTPTILNEDGYAGFTNPLISHVAWNADEQNATDALFLAQAAQTNNAEIALAELALNRSTNPAVRELAQTMFFDHTMANKALEPIFTVHTMSFPSGMSTTPDATYLQLDALSGSDFDRAYVISQIQAHKDALNFYRQGLNSVGDPQAQDYASETWPVIRRHEMALQNLSADLGLQTEITTTNSPATFYTGPDGAVTSDAAYSDEDGNRYDSSSWNMEPNGMDYSSGPDTTWYREGGSINDPTTAGPNTWYQQN